MSFAKPDSKPDSSGPSLRCAAHGCPLHWTVSTHNACSYHAWEEVKHWPSITERLQRFGPWERPHGPESHTVSDMKTRMRHGHRFDATQRIAA